MKSVDARNDEECCPECESVATRCLPTSLHFYGAADWDTAHYNPIFGKVMKSNAQARQEAKSRGMTEVGNEPVEKIHKKFDTEREHKINTAYDDICDTSLGEIRSR